MDSFGISDNWILLQYLQFMDSTATALLFIQSISSSLTYLPPSCIKHPDLLVGVYFILNFFKFLSDSATIRKIRGSWIQWGFLGPGWMDGPGGVFDFSFPHKTNLIKRKAFKIVASYGICLILN